MSAPLPTVLLFEPQFVLRRTLASAARQLGIADVHEAATLAAAAQMARLQRYELAIVALDGAEPTELERFVQGCGTARIVGLQGPGEVATVTPQGVSAVIRKPLKVKELLQFLARGTVRTGAA